MQGITRDGVVRAVGTLVDISQNELMQGQQIDSDLGPIYQAVLDKEDMEHKYDKDAQDVSQYVMIDSVLHHIHMMNNRTHVDHMVLQVCLPKAMVPRILQEM